MLVKNTTYLPKVNFVLGSEFKKLYKRKTFCQVLDGKLTHKKYKNTYKSGLNIYSTSTSNSNLDQSDSDKSKKSKHFKNGFQFREKSKCHLDLHFGKMIVFITIPDDANVYVGENKFFTDKLVVTAMMRCSDLMDKFWIGMVPKNGRVLKFIKDQTDRLCVLAVRQYARALKYVKKNLQSKEICELAVQQDGLLLKYVIDPTERICELAVLNNLDAIEYVQNQFKTEKICKLVGQNSMIVESLNGLVNNDCSSIQSKLSCSKLLVKSLDITNKSHRRANRRNSWAKQYIENRSNTCTYFIYDVAG